jgi:threonyl-tRNA synthetase
MEYVGADDTRQRPIMIHRAIFGSLERFFGILIENYAGDFPLWLAPTQIRLLPVSGEQVDYARQVAHELKQEGYRVEIDQSSERLGKKIRNAELEKIPLVAIIGNREVEQQNLTVRVRKFGDLGAISLSDFKAKLADAIAQKLTFNNIL